MNNNAEEKQLLINQLVSAFSRAYLASKLASQYQGNRDIYKVLGYDENIDYVQCRYRYSRQDIVKAVIDKPVKATWRGGFEVVEAKDSKNTAFEKAFSTLYKDLKLRDVFGRLDRLTLLGQYSLLFMGFDGVGSESQLITPLEKKQKSRLLYLKPFGQNQVSIKSYERDPSNPRYGLPKIYQITFVTPDEKERVVSVHYTRLIHIVHDILDNEIKSEFYLGSIWNRLHDLDKLIGGSAEMFWRGARPGFLTKIDKDFTLTKEFEDALKDQISEYENNLRRILVAEGIDELKTLASQVSDPKSHVDIQLKMISSVTGIPLRILVGSERGELASTQDRENWADFIQSRREEYAEPRIIRPFVDKCIEYGVLPTPGTNDYSVKWQSLYVTSEKDKADVGKIRADALKSYTMSPMAESVVPPKAFFELFLGLNSDEIDYIYQILQEEVNKELSGSKND